MSGLTFEQSISVAVITAVSTFLANYILGLIKEQKSFKREMNYNQLTNLYLTLYAIIAQSEYLRYFHNFEGEFEDIPFLETTHEGYNENINHSSGEVTREEFTVTDAITEFNKQKIYTLILDNDKYATQKLLKLSVQYRYVEKNYTKCMIDDDLKERFQTEELILIKNIVQTIVIETNKMLKECGMEYNEDEILDGILISEVNE